MEINSCTGNDWQQQPSTDYCSPLLAYRRTRGGAKGRSSHKEATKRGKHVCNNRDRAVARPWCLMLKTTGGAATAQFSRFNSVSKTKEAQRQRKMCSTPGDKLIHQSASVWQAGFQVKSSAKSERAGEIEKQWRKTRRRKWEQWGDNCREGRRGGDGGGDTALSGRRFGKASSMCDGL